MDYLFRNKKFNICECSEGYVSPYSQFMIENYPLNFYSSNTLCDFGAGTGVLGIIASLYNFKRIVSIENNIHCYDLLVKNYELNHIKSKKVFLKDSSQCTECFDTIICNPASLPNVLEVNSFCDGGILGIDMILNVLEFASHHLTSCGRLFIIVTGILPYNLIIDKVKYLGFEYRIIAKKVIPFREHYKGVTTWVDSLKTTYKEMYYINDGNNLCEELMLWEIWRE